MIIERESRYVVLKLKDVSNCFSSTEWEILRALCEKVDYYRDCVDKPKLECLVIESDWPEYNTAWNSIVERMSKS